MSLPIIINEIDNQECYSNQTHVYTNRLNFCRILSIFHRNTKEWVHTKTSGTDQFLLSSPQKLTIQKLILQCSSFCLPRLPSLHLEREKNKNTTKAKYIKHQSSFSTNKNIFILKNRKSSLEFTLLLNYHGFTLAQFPSQFSSLLSLF